MEKYHVIPHTADLGFELHAPDLSSLYLQAAQALFDLSYPLDQVKSESEVTIELHGEDREDLMVKWLNELIFLMEARGYFVGRLEAFYSEPSRLSARLLGQTRSTSGTFRTRQIKAATYHNLRISQEADGQWSTQIILDV